MVVVGGVGAGIVQDCGGVGWRCEGGGGRVGARTVVAGDGAGAGVGGAEAGVALVELVGMVVEVVVMVEVAAAGVVEEAVVGAGGDVKVCGWRVAGGGAGAAGGGAPVVAVVAGVLLLVVVVALLSERAQVLEMLWSCGIWLVALGDGAAG